MGHKSICLECKKSFSQGTDFRNIHESNCPNCSEPLTLIPQRFRPPKITDSKKWETVKFLIQNGFKYQHIYENSEELKNGKKSLSNLVAYPENLREAKEFVEKYKQQAITKE
jgi:hypothetical protein